MAAVRLPRPDDTVLVNGHGSVKWRVLAVEDGLAHLTKLYSFERVDFRGVPVGRLTVVVGVFS